MQGFGEWANRSLRMSFERSPSVLSRIPRSAKINVPDNDGKRIQHGSQYALKERLARWIIDENNADRFVSDDVICEKLDEFSRMSMKNSLLINVLSYISLTGGCGNFKNDGT